MAALNHSPAKPGSARGAGPQATDRPQHRAAATAAGASWPPRKSVAPPPVYRPQPLPRVLQTKSHVAPANAAATRQRRTMAPAAREVMLKTVSPNQPPRGNIINPLVAARHLPAGTRSFLPGRPPASGMMQSGTAIRHPVMPAVYRPQPVPRVLQAKTHNPFPARRLEVRKPVVARTAVQPSIRPRRPAPPTGFGGRGVIQAKGPLKVIKTGEITEESQFQDLVRNYGESRYVDMEWRGVTNGMPLYSDSFANCLAVVIHNQERDYGALMHLFPAVMGGTDTLTLFSAVNKELKKIVSWNSHSGGKLELLLWKGISWAPAQNKKLEETGLSYAEYLERKHQKKFVNVIDLMDTEHITANATAMLYVPKSGTIYLVDRDTETALHQIKRDTRSEEDADFAKIEHKMPGYYGEKQRLKKLKREKIEMYITQMESLTIEELQKILKQNYGPEQSEERERAAIYLLEKKQHPGRDPRPPRIKVSDREIRQFL